MPKCAGTSIRNKILKDPTNIHYMSSHDNYSVLNSLNLRYALDWDQYLLVRNPYTWYISWYNYIVNSPEQYNHDALSAFLIYDNRRQVDVKTFIERATDLNWTFRGTKKIKFINNLLKRRNGYLKLYFSDLTQIKFESTLFAHFFNAFYHTENKKIKLYKMETELKQYLIDTEIGAVARDNVSSYRYSLSNEDKKRISKADKDLFTLIGYKNDHS